MKNAFFRKAVAWIVLVAMANPFALAPAYALDSDIYLNVTPGSSAPQPNVMVILDTSDSMNIPEPWREYPGGYDSHVEYLWADMNLISAAEVPAENVNSISTGVPGAAQFSKWGFWKGDTIADRRALWTAAKNSANANFGTDPGPRKFYRNYNDLSWYYWNMESNSANEDTDFRLWSPAFNRFRGYRYEIGGMRGGTSFASSWNFSNRNQCSASLSSLVPSTVLVPTAYPQNAGKFSGTNWKRWNPYRNLDTVNLGSYGLTGVTVNGYATNYLDSTVAPPNTPRTDNTSCCNSVPGDWGLPIRVQQGGSFAGWQNLRADMGGFYFLPMLGGHLYHYYFGLNGGGGTWNTVLSQLRTNYGYPAAGGEFTSALKGNRDLGVHFSRSVGANFYVDIAPGACNPATGPASAWCKNVPTGGSAGVTRYKTRTCGYGAGSTEVDAQGTTRQRGGTCTASPNDGDANCNDQVGSCQCTDANPVNCALIANPAACSMNADNTFFNVDHRWCSWAGRSTVNVGTCTWAGRSSVYLEGIGVYYYGGTCTESGSTASCQISGTVTATLNGVSQSNVTGPYAFPGSPAAAAAGCGNNAAYPPGPYYYGGTCQGWKNDVGTAAGTAATLTGPAAANCNNVSAATYTIRGTVYDNVVYNSAVANCNDKPDNNQACRPGGGSRYNQWCDNPTNPCPSTQTSAVIGATGATPQYYAVYNRKQEAAWAFDGAWWSYYALYPGNHHWSMTVPWNPQWPDPAWQWEDDWFAVHDCMADDGTPGNPGGGHIREHPTPAIGSKWNNGIGHAYTGPGNAFTADPDDNITVYSVNYLNWKFGPRGPNNHPIGRKTRLQIAKAALSTIVNGTDNVRMGLMAFNKTAGCTATGVDATDTDTVLRNVANVGFTVGQAVTVLAVGNNPGTTDLTTTVTAIDDAAQTITLADAPRNSRSTTIQANPCSTGRAAEGAYVASRVQLLGSGATPEKAALTTAINNLQAASRTPMTEALYEAYLYFSGRAPRWGRANTPAVGGGTVTQGRDPYAVCGVGGDPDTDAGSATWCPSAGLYKSPMLSNPSVAAVANGGGSCQKNYIILITDGGPEDDWSANAQIKQMEYNGSAGLVAARTTRDANIADTATAQFEASAGVPYGPRDLASTTFDGGYIWLDELAHFMFKADVSPGATNFVAETLTDRIEGQQNVRTFTIGFAGGNSAVLSNASSVGNSGTAYYVAEDSSALSAALIGALGDILAWTPTFAAPTVPLSVLNRAQNGADVYLAFFEPDSSRAWNGTVKRFAIKTDPTDAATTTMCGAGTDGCFISQTDLGSGYRNIQKSVTGIGGAINVYVNEEASSFWLPAAEQDGGNPRRGGTGYMLLNTAGYDPSNRRVYTYVREAASNSTSAVLSNASNALAEGNALISKTLLGNAGMTDSERSQLINYIRGGDLGNANCSDSDSGTACTAWRSWAHADVQHSRPVVVAYDSTPVADAVLNPIMAGAMRATTQYMYYLTNDGLLHAVDTADGKEKWVYLVEEAFAKLALMKADGAGQQVFGADGSATVHVNDVNGNGIIEAGDSVWLVFGLRRGGRAYYALDITDRDNPAFMWRISSDAPTAGTGRVCTHAACTAEARYNVLGEAWSTPTVGHVKALGGAVPVMIFGGGYDATQDNVPPNAPADTMGTALYVARMDTGAIVAHWSNSAGNYQGGSPAITYSIPSDVAALNMDIDSLNYIDRVYVGDMGGQLWRFDVDDLAPANWLAKRLADLSPAAGAKRKVFFAPAVAKQASPRRFDAIYIGTGDKEKPLCFESNTALFTNPCAAFAPAEKIFMVMDDATGNVMNADAAYTFASGSDFLQLPNDNSATGLNGVAAGDLTGKHGWYRDLDNGEKVTNSPTIFANHLRFGTYAPLGQSVSCAPIGEGRLNEIEGLTGGLFNLNAADGKLPNDRYYLSFLSHGLVSSGQFIVIGNKVYHIVVQSGIPRFNLVATLGTATRIFWYMEPER